MLRRGEPAHWRDESRGGVRRPTPPIFRRHLQAAPSRGVPTGVIFTRTPGPPVIPNHAPNRPRGHLFSTQPRANYPIGVLTGRNQKGFRGVACPP